MIRAGLRSRASRWFPGLFAAEDRHYMDWEPSSGGWGGGTTAGIMLTPELAMQVPAFRAGVSLIAGSLASMSLPVYKRLPNNGRQDYPQHPLYDLLNYMPNRWQTAFEWRRMMTAHVLTRGNGYSEIVPGPRGFADRLEPIHPTRVRPVRMPDGSISYRVAPGGASMWRPEGGLLLQEEMFHLRDLSFTTDGVCGTSRVDLLREVLAGALAAQIYANAYFGNGAEASIALMYDKSLQPEQRKTLAESWKASHGGVHKAGAPAVLEMGVKVEKLSLSNKDSQFLELQSFYVEQIARGLEIPLHLLQSHDKQTSFGTGVEQMTIAFLKFGLLSFQEMWEQTIARDLIIAPHIYFVEHLTESLLRSDYKARMEGYHLGIMDGVFCPDEVRQFENLPPRADGLGGVYLRPANMVPADTPASATGQQQTTAPAPPPNGSNGAVHYSTGVAA